MTKNYGILRIAKLHKFSDLKGVSDHHSRDPNSNSISHVEPDGDVELLLGNWNALGALHDRLAEANIKPHKRAVLATDTLMTFSPAALDDPGFDMDRWIQSNILFAKKLFGEKNILQMSLHNDESTPHIHVISVPIVETERKKRGRKTKGTVETPPELVQALSYRQQIGGGHYDFIALQDRYYEEVCKNLNLNRGERGALQTHEHPRTYNARVQEFRNQKMAEAQIRLDQANKELERILERQQDELIHQEETSDLMDETNADLSETLTEQERITGTLKTNETLLEEGFEAINTEIIISRIDTNGEDGLQLNRDADYRGWARKKIGLTFEDEQRKNKDLTLDQFDQLITKKAKERYLPVWDELVKYAKRIKEKLNAFVKSLSKQEAEIKNRLDEEKQRQRFQEPELDSR